MGKREKSIKLKTWTDLANLMIDLSKKNKLFYELFINLVDCRIEYGNFYLCLNGDIVFYCGQDDKVVLKNKTPQQMWKFIKGYTGG